MKLVVISCWKYRDAWKPFFQLLEHFWPDCPYEKYLVTDHWGDEAPIVGVNRWNSDTGGWSDTLCSFAQAFSEEPILLFQEDFFLSETVRSWIIQRALLEFNRLKAGCLRLYPMPGAEGEYGNLQFGCIPAGTPYRISCQAAIWDPAYLARICEVGGMAMHFEINGSNFSNTLPQPVLGWKREVKPWPLEYICSAISAGRWDPNAKKLCQSLGIEADFSMRTFA